MSRREHLPALTGVRFLLAAHVVLFHSYPTFEALPKPLFNIVGAGYIGVEMFFVLSGFVLTYTYVELGRPAQGKRGAPIAKRSFYVARLARIYPLYLLALASFLPEALAWAPNPFLYDPAKGLAHVVAVQTWIPDWVISWNIPGWSIGTEFFFYLLFPWLAAPLLRGVTRRALWLTVGAAWLLGSLATTLWAVRDPEGWGFVPSAGEGPFMAYSTLLNVVKFNPLLHLPAFAVGMAFGALFLLDRRDKAKRSGGSMTWIAAAGILTALAFASEIPFPLLHNGLLTPLYGLLFYGLAHGGGVAGRWLGARPMILLGNASFAVYLLQSSLILVWGRYVGEPYPGKMGLENFALFFALLVGLSIAAYKLYETPMRRRLRARLGAARPAQSSR